eukprot:3617534-Amphidinium_carterae.1
MSCSVSILRINLVRKGKIKDVSIKIIKRDENNEELVIRTTNVIMLEHKDKKNKNDDAEKDNSRTIS